MSNYVKSSKMAKNLLIEDSKKLALALKPALEGEGYEMFWAEDGIKGLEIAKKEIPNLILLDLMLPKVSGFEICKQLKQHEKTFKIPVVIISTLNKEEDIALAKQMGADKYIGKPYNLSEILEEVKYLLCS